MGFSDIVEFIKKVNQTNDTSDWIENSDGIDNSEGGLEQQIQEETILFQVSPTSAIAIVLIFFIIFFIILNSTKYLKSVYKFFKNYNKQFNRLFIFHDDDDNDNDKRFKINRDKSLSTYETSSISSSGSGLGDGKIRPNVKKDGNAGKCLKMGEQSFFSKLIDSRGNDHSVNSGSQSFREQNESMTPDDKSCKGKNDRYLLKYSRRKLDERLIPDGGPKFLYEGLHSGLAPQQWNSC